MSFPNKHECLVYSPMFVAESTGRSTSEVPSMPDNALSRSSPAPYEPAYPSSHASRGSKGQHLPGDCSHACRDRFVRPAEGTQALSPRPETSCDVYIALVGRASVPLRRSGPPRSHAVGRGNEFAAPSQEPCRVIGSAGEIWKVLNKLVRRLDFAV